MSPLLEQAIANNNLLKSLVSFTLPSMMKHAAGNNHIDFMKWLLKKGASCNAPLLFSESPLHSACAENSEEAIDFLIANGADINYQGENKISPIFFAIHHGHINVVHKLVEKGADLTLNDTNGNTVLSYAVNSKNIEIISYLLKTDQGRELVHRANIYGMTPVDYAIESNFTDAIKLLDTSSNTSPRVHTHFIPINQSAVMKKIRYYLASQYRDFDFFEEKGNCNAFAFLRDWYAYHEMEDYYVDTLSMMSSWDGTEETLQKRFDTNLSQARFYNNLAELFEQWTNDMIWFQHSTLESLYETNQKPLSSDRPYQYSIIGKDEEKPILISKIAGDSTLSQFIENVSLLSKKMLQGTRLEISGSKHATSGFINSKNEYSYYDPNFSRKTVPVRDPNVFGQIVVDTKIISLNQISNFDSAEFNNELRFFYYDNPVFRKKLEEFEVFNENELPKNDQEAKQYQKNSPNQYTHLHVAVLAGSLVTAQKLISSGCINLNEKDIHEQTALALAIKARNDKLCDIILEGFAPPNYPDSSPFLKAYEEHDQKIIDLMFNHYNKIDIKPIFFQAIKNKDYNFINRVMTLNAIDINSFFNQKSPIISAIENDDTFLTNLFLKNGASLFTVAPKDTIGYSTPLFNLVKINPELITVALPFFKDINQSDRLGNSLIHYLHYAKDIKSLIEKLSSYNTDFLKVSTSGKTIFDLLSEDLFSLESEKLPLYKLLIQVSNFDESTIKQDILKNILFMAIKNKNEELINVVLPKCSRETINAVNKEGIPLLAFACAYANKKTVEKIISAGGEINRIFPPSQNTCLHFLVIKNNTELTKLFLEYNADVQIKNKNDETVLDLVQKSDNDEIKSLFEKYYPYRSI